MGKRINLEDKIEKVAEQQYPNDKILRDALMFGAWWFYNEALDKVVDFVRKNLCNYVEGKTTNINVEYFCKDLVNQLKK